MLATADEIEALLRKFDPSQPRDKAGKWSLLGAIASLGKKAGGDGSDRPLAERVRSGVKSTVVLTGGNRADSVERVTFGDGSTAVRKRATSPVDHDAEELAAGVAHVLGVRAPAVHRTSDHEAYFELVDGSTGLELSGGDRLAKHAAVADSDEGVLLGFFDAVVGNPDRHSGNWVVSPDGHLVAIDHGLAFSDPKPGHEAHNRHNTFGKHFATAGQWNASNPMSPADIAEARRRIASLRPEYERKGATAWFDAMMARLGALGARASGSTDRLT